jgi:hypothetical protein
MIVVVCDIRYKLEGRVPLHQIHDLRNTLPSMIIVSIDYKKEFDERIRNYITDKTGFEPKSFSIKDMDKDIFLEWLESLILRSQDRDQPNYCDCCTTKCDRIDGVLVVTNIDQTKPKYGKFKRFKITVEELP